MPLKSSSISWILTRILASLWPRQCIISDFVLSSLANIPLARSDTCMDHLRSSIKQDTLASLRSPPLIWPLCSQTLYLERLRTRSLGMKTEATLVEPTRSKVITLRHIPPSHHRTLAVALDNHPRRLSVHVARRAQGKASDCSTLLAKVQSSYK